MDRSVGAARAGKHWRGRGLLTTTVMGCLLAITLGGMPAGGRRTRPTRGGPHRERVASVSRTSHSSRPSSSGTGTRALYRGGAEEGRLLRSPAQLARGRRAGRFVTDPGRILGSRRRLDDRNKRGDVFRAGGPCTDGPSSSATRRPVAAAAPTGTGIRRTRMVLAPRAVGATGGDHGHVDSRADGHRPRPASQQQRTQLEDRMGPSACP